MAREVADILEADGYRVTVQDYDFAASGQFVRDIDHATRQPRFLLVYDNAPNPAALAGLPPSRGARMLITSRHPDRAAQAREFLTLCPTPPLWGHEPGRRPHYSLRTVKAAFADAARINRTMTAAVGADELGLDEHAVLDVIAGLTARDFDKSMSSEVNPTVWQDV